MSKQTLAINDIEVNKKDFYTSKKAIRLNLINTNNIVISYRVKQNNDTFKYFAGYSHDDGVIKPLCIASPQMRGYIKYFKNGGKACHLKLKMKIKCNEIWNKIKSILNVKSVVSLFMMTNIEKLK